MEQKGYTNWLKRIFTPRRLKLGAVLVVVCAIVAGGGAWYYHQQKMERKAQIQQAQTRMVEYQAAQRNVQLIGVEDIKAIAAQAVSERAPRPPAARRKTGCSSSCPRKRTGTGCADDAGTARRLDETGRIFPAYL